MRFSILGVVVATALFSGCESVTDATSAVRDRLAERSAPQVRTFAAPQREVYAAARTAAQQMGYRVVRGGAAQGVIEAVSGVAGGDRMGSSRQLALNVRLEPDLDGGTVTSVRITEIIEADSSNRAGQATETPLRDTPQYDVFFQRVERLLSAGPAAPPS